VLNWKTSCLAPSLLPTSVWCGSPVGQSRLESFIEWLIFHRLRSIFQLMSKWLIENWTKKGRWFILYCRCIWLLSFAVYLVRSSCLSAWTRCSGCRSVLLICHLALCLYLVASCLCRCRAKFGLMLSSMSMHHSLSGAGRLELPYGAVFVQCPESLSKFNHGCFWTEEWVCLYLLVHTRISVG
jgi:hypothetical protein